MLTKEQLEARRNGLGGSDIAAILGLSDWVTPLEIYMRKRGELPEQEDRLRLRLGNTLEPIVRSLYEEETNNLVHLSEITYRHPNYNYMLANVDGILADNHIVEFKTANFADGWGRNGINKIPDYYFTQVQHYMTVLNVDFCDVAVLIGLNELRIYTIEKDNFTSNFLIEKETQFWEMVQNGTPPSMSTINDWQLAYGKFSKENAIECMPIKDSLAKLKQIQTQIKELEQQANNLKVGIMEFMGENKELTLNDKKIGGIITKSLIGWDFDALKADKEVKEKYMTKPTNSAYFQLSARKDLNEILGVKL